MKVLIGTKMFTLSLHDSESARAFLKRFPMTVTMQEPNGNELFAYMDENLPTDAQRATKIHTGDVKLFGRDCPMLFYKDFTTAYSYTSLGKVDDAEALAQAWIRHPAMCPSPYLLLRFAAALEIFQKLWRISDIFSISMSYRHAGVALKA